MHNTRTGKLERITISNSRGSTKSKI